MNKKRITIILLLLFIMASWSISVYIERFAASNYNGVSVRLEGEGVAKEKLEHAIKKEQEKEVLAGEKLLQASAWNRGPRITITNETLNTTTKARIIQVMGDMAKVCPVTIQYGNFCYADDKKGCVIDEKTAYAMFRDKNVVGGSIFLKEKEYIIRGVIKSKEPVVMIIAKENDVSFTNMELTFESVEQANILTQNFIDNYQLTSDYITMIEGGFWAKLLRNASLLPAVFLWIYLCVLLGRRAYRKRHIPVQCITYTGLFLLLVQVLFRSKRLSLYYPQRWIPTRWSDFEFFHRLFQEFNIQWMDYSYLVPLPKDKILFHIILLSLLMSVVTIVLLLRLIQSLKKINKKESKNNS